MKPGSAPKAARISSSVAGRASLPSAFWSLIWLTRWSPRTSASTSVPSSFTIGTDFKSVARVDAQQPRDLLDRARVRRRPPRSGAASGAGNSGCGGVPGRDLHVRGVAGVGERDLVLARRAGRHVLVRAQPAHHPDVRLDLVPAQAAAVEDAVVGLGVAPVRLLQSVDVAVEAVGVLHDELARAQHAGARARLVALLGLDVVEHQRQVAVGAHVARDVERDALLVRHRQHERAPVAVLELEQLRDAAAPGAVPQLARMQHRHRHLVRADAVHLLAQDLLDPPVHPPSGGQVGPQARAQLANQAGAHHQDVRDRLGVGRRFLQRWAGNSWKGASSGSGPRVYRRVPLARSVPYAGALAPRCLWPEHAGQARVQLWLRRDISARRLFEFLCCP